MTYRDWLFLCVSFAGGVTTAIVIGFWIRNGMQ